MTFERVRRSDSEGRLKRNAIWRTMAFRGASYSMIGRLYGVSHATVKYALDADYRARKQTQMFLYYNKQVCK